MCLFVQVLFINNTCFNHRLHFHQDFFVNHDGYANNCLLTMRVDEDEDEQGDWEDYENMVQAYICHFSPKTGNLDMKKCQDLGVKSRPMLGMVKAGKDVTLEYGKVVRSCDVVGGIAPGSGGRGEPHHAL